ncbi:HNH endonuclease [Desmospora activa]|uniref:Colicin-lik bacteriocin with DNase/tRNase domain n=1 Tax=Desmospora activa DSM 45169 TaxID=1121389 RepID=A0A2T4Z916_9BACL|nr:HNH endonuclease [Desmospora activa]PTM58365.1 colicin-lik bacteriocin with DNase/tRNase domain [Desmospora activa DSM 45169]
MHAGHKRNTVDTKEINGVEYTIRYDEDAFVDFTPYAKRDQNGNLLEIQLPADSVVGSSNKQTVYATKLLRERYPNWETEFGFTESQIEAIKKNKGSIGPGIKNNPGPGEQLTWHHDKEAGKMILVPYDLNNGFDHTGGHKFWGNQEVN